MNASSGMGSRARAAKLSQFDSNVQEYLFFCLTMCGRSSLAVSTAADRMQKLIGETGPMAAAPIIRWNLLRFAGYDYLKLTVADEFQAAIIASIDGKAVIAKVRQAGRFRITGYDDGALICPDTPTRSKNRRVRPPMTSLSYRGQIETALYAEGRPGCMRQVMSTISGKTLGRLYRENGLVPGGRIARQTWPAQARMQQLADTMVYVQLAQFRGGIPPQV